jgi:hypothetical protein
MLLRIVAMPAEGAGPGWMREMVGTAVQQNAYDYVDLVGGFFGLGGSKRKPRPLKGDDTDEEDILRAMASHPVSQHIARWDSAPTLVPGGGKTGGAQQPDGPIAGNGDFGVSIGGGRECCKGRCCTAEGGPGTDGKPGSLNNIADRPGAASLVNADLALFYGKNDFWCEYSNGRPQPSRHAVV